MSAETLRKAAEVIRFDAPDPTGPWSLLPDGFGPAVADLLESAASGFIEINAVSAVARAYLGDPS